MRKIIVSEFITLDGVIESNEKWQFPYFSDDLAEFGMKQILALDAILLGRSLMKYLQLPGPPGRTMSLE